MNRLEIKKMTFKNSIWAFLQGFPILLASFILITSCYVPPSGTPISEPVEPPPVGEIKLPPVPAVKPPPAQVYFYPKSGQSPEQQDRDRFECYNWAKQQTGFDPIILPRGMRVTVVPAMRAAAGASSGTARQGQAKQIEEPYSSQDQVLFTKYEKKGMDFRRAMSACLEGRGYSVR